MIVVNMKQIHLDNNWKIIFSILGVTALLMLLWFFRVIIAYLLIAAVVSFVGEPLMRGLKKITIKKRCMPSWLCALITLLTFGVVILGLVLMFTPLLIEEINIISQIDPTIVAERLQIKWNELQGVVQSSGVGMDQNEITQFLINEAKNLMSFGWVSSLFGNIFGFASSIIIGFFAVLFIAFFFLKDGLLFARMVFTLTPDRHMDKVKNIMEHSHHLLGRYFVGIVLQSLIMTAMVSISLYILGVQNALLIGLFGGIMNVIPYLGPLLGGTFGIVVALTTGLHLDFNAEVLPLLGKVLAVFIVAQQIDGFIVQPLVLGNSVKAHPLEIFIVVLAAGTIAGIMGMVLAIPAYTILRVVAREFLSEFKVVDSLTRDLNDE